MASQTTEILEGRIGAESRWQRFGLLQIWRNEGVHIQFALLAAARVLFSVVLLNSVINWDDLHWTSLHFLALIPFLWALVAIILSIAGLFQWKTGGRLMTVTDIVICSFTVVFFPDYILPALALSVLSSTHLTLRHDGRFAGYAAALPLAAMLVRPLGGLESLNMNWPVSHLDMGVAGQIVAFVLSLLAVIFFTLINTRMRVLRRPLTFQQPWEDEFTLGVGKHNIQPVLDRLEYLFPGGKAICVLESTKKSEGTSIVSSSSFRPNDIEPLRSELTSTPGQESGAIILALDNGFYVDVTSGKRAPIPPAFEKLARGLKGLGFGEGILQDFQLSHLGVKLFYSTGGRLDEAVRKDVAHIGKKIHAYFDKATKWDLQRQDMIALARDLARRDLHDGILQSLAALKMRLVTIAAAPAFSSHPDVESLRKTIDIITLEQSRLRALLHNDEDTDDSINLVEAMEVCLQTLSLQWEISVKLKSHEPALPVDKESAENIEYLIREAVANAIRHAGAKQLTVALSLNKGNLLMTLKDDHVDTSTNPSSHQDAQSVLRSRSLIQRLALVNGHAYSDGMEDSTLLAISIPMDFTANE